MLVGEPQHPLPSLFIVGTQYDNQGELLDKSSARNDGAGSFTEQQLYLLGGRVVNKQRVSLDFASVFSIQSHSSPCSLNVSGMSQVRAMV